MTFLKILVNKSVYADDTTCIMPHTHSDILKILGKTVKERLTQSGSWNQNMRPNNRWWFTIYVTNPWNLELHSICVSLRWLRNVLSARVLRAVYYEDFHSCNLKRVFFWLEPRKSFRKFMMLHVKVKEMCFSTIHKTKKRSFPPL